MSELRGGGYRVAVAEYLRTGLGRTTPPQVAARLAGLDPNAVGMSEAPTGAQLHNTRIFLESTSENAGCGGPHLAPDIHQLRNGTG